MKYWLSVIFGAIDEGLIAAIMVLLGGHDPTELAASGTITVNFSKTNVSLAILAGAYVMFKNVRAYLKVPIPPEGK